MPKTSLDLTGVWEFKQYPLSARRMRDLSSADWIQTPVPSSIFDSLIQAGQIERSELNANPENFSSVSEKPWIYKKVFDCPAKMLSCDRIDLVFDGLDTIASIWLNHKLIAKTDNMFIPFRFDVTKNIKPRNNTLLVKFEPPASYAKKLMSRYTKFSKSGSVNLPRVYIRKAQYQFGWDFCPALPGCGIWRPVRLEGTQYAKIEDLNIRTVDCNHNYADIKIAVKLDTVTKEQFSCRITLSCGDQTIQQSLLFKSGEDFHSTLIRIENPALWWPAGYGQQHLYQIDVKLLKADEIVDQTQKSFGIRTVKLNRSQDKYGENFRFEINGQHFFAMDANWVPALMLAGSVTGSDYQKLLHSAAEANINMLRVWGGGYYEADEFYQLCDQFGIMVWQDFMFACAYYSGRAWFTEQVKTEAAAIIKRLRNHPCLALWCGNNEIDWINWMGKSKKFYGKAIYHKLLPLLVAELDPDRDYIPTTPFTTADNKEPNDPSSGTIHQWEIWFFNAPVREYICSAEKIPRFVTEFGLQSLPNMKTIKELCSPEQLRIGSFPIEKHSYQLDGNSRIYRYMGDLFSAADNIEQFVYLSQVTQARGVKAYVEHLRAHGYRNNGVLFWQFNICCPAISWSAVDCDKEPKALYYYAKRFFSKLLVTAVTQSDKAKDGTSPDLQSISAIVINSSNQPLTATLNCRLIDLLGNLLDQVAFPIAIAPFSISALLKLPKAIIFPDAPEKSCIHLVMGKNGKKIAENLFFYLPDKYIDWPEVQISKQLSQITGKQWKLKLKSNAIARDVQISTAVPAQFSSNFIDLVPSDEFEIKEFTGSFLKKINRLEISEPSGQSG